MSYLLVACMTFLAQGILIDCARAASEMRQVSSENIAPQEIGLLAEAESRFGLAITFATSALADLRTEFE